MRRDEWDTPAKIIAAHFDDKEGKAVRGPSRYSVVCGSHFDDADYPQWNYDGKLKYFKVFYENLAVIIKSK